MNREKNSNWCAFGKLYREHGLKGEMTFKLFSPDGNPPKKGEKILIQCGEKEMQSHVEKISPHKEGFLILLENINSPNEAKNFRQATLLVSKQKIKPKKGEALLVDLIGFEVCDMLGASLGFLKGLEGNTAKVFLVVEHKEGKSFLVPDQSLWIKKIDSTQKQIWLELPEGYLETFL